MSFGTCLRGLQVGGDVRLARAPSRPGLTVRVPVRVFCARVFSGAAEMAIGSGSVRIPLGIAPAGLCVCELFDRCGLTEALLAEDQVGGLVSHVLVFGGFAVAQDGRDDRTERRCDDE